MTNPPPLAVLRIVVLISIALRSGAGDALGLGPMRLQSALGQPLHATVQVLGPEARSLPENCIRGKLLSPDGSEIVRPETELKRRNGQTEIAIATRAVVEEPAVTLLIEVTCAPEMHRDYQLLLDLRDGLPRVVAQDADVAASVKSSAVQRASASGETGAERRRKPRGRAPVLAAEAGRSADALEVAADEGEVKLRSRARGLPGARNVLKLTQIDLDLGKKPAPGLRLSQTLSSPVEGAKAADTEDILAAKARFMAMLHNEDPVQIAQRQVRGLQAQLKRAAVSNPAGASNASNAAIAARSSVFSSATSSGRFGDINYWLIGMGALVLAAIGVLSAMYRSAPRGAKKTASPWWAASDDAAQREAKLVEAAREIASARKQPAQPIVGEIDRMLAEEKILHQYINNFLPSETPKDARTGRKLGTEATPLPAADAAIRDTAAAPALLDEDAAHGLPHPMGPLPRDHALQTFELVSDVMQEAEFWKMLNETKRAIDILENYCNGDSASSPVPWLYLADLYQSSGDLERYGKLQDNFRKHFNCRMSEDTDANGLRDTRHSLEDYPHLMQKISSLWGQPEIVPFMQELLLNDRDAPRQGFNLPVYREILMLIEVAREREQEFA
jgi:pilus assembly protein FimV